MVIQLIKNVDDIDSSFIVNASEIKPGRQYCSMSSAQYNYYWTQRKNPNKSLIV
jgi:hypothetical protein